eukprot:9492570-Pyramimonas_sp.AAC.1
MPNSYDEYQHRAASSFKTIADVMVLMEVQEIEAVQLKALGTEAQRSLPNLCSNVASSEESMQRQRVEQ